MSSNKTIQIPKVIPNDWVRLRIIIDKLKYNRLGGGSTPEFAGVKLTSLTQSRLVASDASKELVSSDLVNWVTGTANRVIVADDAAGGIVISGPQDIHTGATNFTVAGLTVTGNSVFGLNSSVFQPNADSTTFLQVKNAAGTGYPISIDTTNIRVGMGTNTPAQIIHIVSATDPKIRIDSSDANWAIGVNSTDPSDGSLIIQNDEHRANPGDNWNLASSVFGIDTENNIYINSQGHQDGGTLFQYSKVGNDSVFNIFEAALDRGGGVGGVGLGLGYLFRLENGNGDRHDAGSFRYEWSDPTAGSECSKFVISNYMSGNPNDSLAINGTGFIGINENLPETLTEWTHATPYLTLHNSTHEDSDGGRESRLNFKGEQSGGEETTLARIEVGHDGPADDEKGFIDLYTNDGSDGDSPTKRIRVDSSGLAKFFFAVSVAGFHSAVTTKTNTDYTLTVNDDVVLFDTGATTRTATLPAASTATGKIYHIKKIDAGAGLVTIDGNASETIDGDLMPDITAQYESFMIVSDGSNWHVI